MSTKRLKRRAHQRVSKDTERLSLAPLSFTEALKGALATKPKRDVDQEQEIAGDDDNA
jgi:hypothetical protein